MNAKELKTGLVVAVTAGTNGFDRQPQRTVKAEVVKPASAGRVQVRLLEASHHGVGYHEYGLRKEEPPPAGTTISVKTKNVWMDWETFERRKGNERQQRQQREAEEEARESRLVALQERIDQLAGQEDTALAWAGLRHQPGGVETHLRVPRPVLEALLDRAER